MGPGPCYAAAGGPELGRGMGDVLSGASMYVMYVCMYLCMYVCMHRIAYA